MNFSTRFIIKPIFMFIFMVLAIFLESFYGLLANEGLND